MSLSPHPPIFPVWLDCEVPSLPINSEEGAETLRVGVQPPLQKKALMSLPYTRISLPKARQDA
eukprot:132831-Amphidinium_carterae.1